MGNAAKNGCLGPKPREKDVYAQLVDLIHQEVQVSDTTDPLSPNSYQAVSNKIVKKGYLRKLVDHLSSHRSKVSDCIYHNLKVILHLHNIKNTYVGLFIVDEVIRSCKENKNTEYPSYDEDFTSTTPINPVSSQIFNKSMSFSLEGKGKGTVDIKFEAAYFKFILQLFKIEETLYVRILQSVDAFCLGRKEKLTCKAEVSKIIDIIMQQIKLMKHVDESSQTYLNLILLTKEGVKDQYVSQTDLMLFTKLWLKDQQKIIKTPEMHVPNTQYESIIREIIFRCVSSRNLTKIILHTLFVFYDQDRFTGFRVLQIETLFLKTIAQNDLRYQIFRNLFIYLIEYISESEINNKKYTKETAIESFEHPKYLHASEISCKLHAFQTLRRWQEHKYINLDELISYNCQILVKAYILNIDGDQQTAKSIIAQFLKMNQLISEKSNFMIINLLLEEIRWDLTRQSLKKIMITLIREILQSRKLLQMPLSDFASFFSPIDHRFSLESRVELIQLTGYIVRHLEVGELINEVDSNNISISFCEFFYSMYEGLLMMGSDDKAGDLFLYTNAIKFFLKCFYDKKLLGFIAGFLKALKNRMISNATKSSVISLYCQLYVFYEGYHLLNAQQQLPSGLVQLNKQIISSNSIMEMQPKIEELISELLTSGPESKNIHNVHRITFESVNKAANISHRYEKQIADLFDLNFKGSRIQGDQQELFPYRKSQFYRNTAKNQFYNSVMSKNPFELDQSFRDVFAGINDM